MLVKFVVNNKIHPATKVSPFMANYDRVENKADIRRKEKIEKTIGFAERIKKI